MSTLIRIKDCSECRDCQSNQTATADSFDVAWDYYCHNGKKLIKIAGYVNWNEKMPAVPKWCPRRNKVDGSPAQVRKGMKYGK